MSIRMPFSVFGYFFFPMEPKTSDTLSDVSATPTGEHDTSIPPAVIECFKRQGFSEEESRKMATVLMDIHRTHDQWPKPSKYKPRPEGMQSGVTFVNYDIDSVEAAIACRKGRKYETNTFRFSYVYDNINKEERSCVWAEDVCSFSEKSSGIMWVGVHGADSICVVTSKGVLDEKRLTRISKKIPLQIVHFLFRKSIICEIEDLADPSSELREKIQKNIKKPFGVVSVNPRTDNIFRESGLEASSGEHYDVTKATDFLKQKMNGGTNFTVDETIKTAIHAFQHLFRKKLEAADIEVSVMDPEYFRTVFTGDKDLTVKDLQNYEIQEHLDAFDELEEHLGVTDLGNTPKKNPGDSPGGSSNISETTDYSLVASRL